MSTSHRHLLALPQIRGYRLFAKVASPRDPEFVSMPGECRLLVGTSRGAYLIPPAIDPIELGLFPAPGYYELHPIDINNEPIRDQVIHLYVSEWDWKRQKGIWRKCYDAFLALIPHDASDIDRAVQSNAASGLTHEVLEMLAESTLEVWRTIQTPCEQLTNGQRDLVYARVAEQTYSRVLHSGENHRVDKASIHALLGNTNAVMLARIEHALFSVEAPVDAVARALARVGMRLAIPARCCAALLPHATQIDVAFTLLRAADRPFDVLPYYVPGLGYMTSASPPVFAADSGTIIRVLFGLHYLACTAIPASREHHEWLRSGLLYIADAKVSAFDAALRWQLGRAIASPEVMAIIEGIDITLDDVHEVTSTAIQALNRHFDIIVSGLPAPREAHRIASSTALEAEHPHDS